jgi:hypothetical protein
VVVDVAYLNLDFGDGLIANFHVNWLSPVKVRSMIIGGSDQSLIYNDLDTGERIRVYDRGISTISDEEKHKSLISYRTGDMYSPNVSHDKPLSIVASDFVRCIRQKKDRPQTRSPDCASSGFWRRPNVASRRRAAGSSAACEPRRRVQRVKLALFGQRTGVVTRRNRSLDTRRGGPMKVGHAAGPG